MTPLFGRKEPKKPEDAPKKKTSGKSTDSKEGGKGGKGGKGARIVGKRPGRAGKGKKDGEGGADGKESVGCEVPKCEEEYTRSISFKKAKAAMNDWKLDDGPRRIHVCKDHYREFKKATKKDRNLDKAGWMERSGRYDGNR